MNIGFVGCSFTQGAELVNREETRWSRLVCDKLRAKELNTAVSGASNEMICMKAVEMSYKSRPDFLVVQFTTCIRFSLALDKMILAIGPNQQARNKAEELICKIAFSQEISPPDWYKLFRWKALTLHSFLNENKINHMFMYMLDYEPRTMMTDKYVPQSFKDRSVFVGMREYCQKNNLPIGRFLHPLEEAQKAIAYELVLPKIGSLV